MEGTYLSRSVAGAFVVRLRLSKGWLKPSWAAEVGQPERGGEDERQAILIRDGSGHPRERETKWLTALASKESLPRMTGFCTARSGPASSGGPRGATIKERFETRTWMRDPEGNDFCVVPVIADG